MLKRSDLAKQFELVVQQEIINHNEAISANNKALNKLRADILLLRGDLLKGVASFNSEIVKDRQALSNVWKAIDEAVEDLSIKSGKIREEFKKSISNVNMFITEESTKHVKNDLFSVFKQSIASAIKNVTETIVSLKNAVVVKIEALEKHITKVIKYQDEKLDETLESIESFKSDLITKIEIASVDSKGVLREIAILKKSLYIESKKIENIYTLIERLKK